MSGRYHNTILILACLLSLSAYSQSIFIEVRSIPRTIVTNAGRDYAHRKSGFADAEAGWEFKNNFVAGLHFSWNKYYFDYPGFYYQNHNLNEFWQQSYSPAIFLKKKFSIAKLFNPETKQTGNSFLIGAYLFFNLTEVHQLIALRHPYGMYEIPINIKENKFSYALQFAKWFTIRKNLVFEPAIQLGYFKKNSQVRRGPYFISGQGEIFTNGISLNITLSIIYLIRLKTHPVNSSVK